MPRTNEFPKYDFETQFQIATDSIHEYFAFAREVYRRWRSRLTQLQHVDQKRRRLSPGRRRYASKVCRQIAREYEISISQVYQLRKAAESFSDAEVEELLAACKEVWYVPSRETFVALSRVPQQHRRDWFARMLRNRWTADQLKEEILREFGKRSYGGRLPDAPCTVEQAERQLQKILARLDVLRATLVQANQAVGEYPEWLKIRVPRKHLRPLQEPTNVIEAVQNALDDAKNTEQAA